MANVKARECYNAVSPSDWVFKIFLTCDNQIAVWFKEGQKVKKIREQGPGAYLGFGGHPSVCCLYPGTQGETAVKYYDFALLWPFAGEWVHQFLYKKFPYKQVNPPQNCGGCNTQAAIQSSNNNPNAGDVVTFTATITNTDGSAAHGASPTGSVTFKVDGASIGTVSLPASSAATNAASATQNWTATAGTHTIEADYTPADSQFSSSSASMNLTVGGVSTACCPNNTIPTTLHLTVSNVSGCTCMAGTYALTYDSGSGAWVSASGTLCGTVITGPMFHLSCVAGSFSLSCNAFGSVVMGSLVCSPFSCSASNVAVDPSYCAGSVNLSVTT